MANGCGCAHGFMPVEVILSKRRRYTLDTDVTQFQARDLKHLNGTVNTEVEIHRTCKAATSCGPPIGCNVKRESRAISGEFSSLSRVRGEPRSRQRRTAPLRLLLRRRLSTVLHPDLFFARSGAARSPQRVKAARGPFLIAARSASFHRPIARSSWP